MSFRLGAGQRVVFLGLPGSGKTNLIAAFLLTVRSFVVIDSKRHPDEWPAWAKKHGIHVTRDPEDINRRDDKGGLLYPRLIVQVDQRALLDRGGWRPGATSAGKVWTDVLEAIVARGRRISTLVVFDEVIQTLPAGASHPLAWQMYTQGAAFGLSVWAGTQIANRMETLVTRLAEHCFCFWVGNRKEQELLANARGVDCSGLSQLQPHHFAYHRNGPNSQWVICPPVPFVLAKHRDFRDVVSKPKRKAEPVQS